MYAFVHIPKTAGSTLRHILRRSFGSRHCDIRCARNRRAGQAYISPRDLRAARFVYPVLLGIAGHRVASFAGLEQAAPDIHYFTFLREPGARLVSHFHYARGARTDANARQALIEFCADPRQRNVQTRWICGSEDAPAAIAELERRIGFVGLTERFDESLVLLSHWLNVDDQALSYRSRNRRNPPSGQARPVEDELRDHILDANRADIEVYRYAVDNIFRRQVAAGGPHLSERVHALQKRNAELRETPEALWSRVKRNLIYKPILHLGLI